MIGFLSLFAPIPVSPLKTRGAAGNRDRHITALVERAAPTCSAEAVRGGDLSTSFWRAQKNPHH
jgi:hypothetical protein